MSRPTPDQLVAGKYTSNPTTISLSTSAASCAALTSGCVYTTWATVDWFWLQGPVATVTASASSIPLKAYQPWSFWVDSVDNSVSGIVSSGTGTAYLVKAIAS